MIAAVELPLPLTLQLESEALRAYPRECCGLLEGSLTAAANHAKSGKGEPDSTAMLRVTALHPTANIAEHPDQFEIDPAAHIALARDLRSTGRGIIGCYHSHPNGRAEPSERDCEHADGEGFLWLIAAVDHDGRAAGISAFVFGARGFLPVPIVHETLRSAGASGRAPS